MQSNRFDAFKNKVFRTIATAIGLLIIVNVYGTIGLVYVQGTEPFDAFYMTVISITTVGYGEAVELTHEGRIFMISVIYLGLVSSGVCVAMIANLFFEETLLDIFKGHHKEKRLKTFSNHYIVCGYGTTGRGIVEELLAQNDQVVVIDQVERRSSKPNLIFLHGDARQDDILENAGILKAQGLATTLTEDADNVFVVLTARALNPKLTIVSRFKDDDTEKKLRTAGANHMISPYRMGGHRLALALTNPPFLEVLDATFSQSANLDVHFTHLKVPENARIREKMLKDSEIRQHSLGALIVAVLEEDGRTVFNPSSDYHLKNASQLLVMGDDQQVNALSTYLHSPISNRPVSSV